MSSYSKDSLLFTMEPLTLPHAAWMAVSCPIYCSDPVSKLNQQGFTFHDFTAFSPSNTHADKIYSIQARFSMRYHLEDDPLRITGLVSAGGEQADTFILNDATPQVCLLNCLPHDYLVGSRPSFESTLLIYKITSKTSAH